MKAIYSELEYSLDRHRPASVVAMLSKEEVCLQSRSVNQVRLLSNLLEFNKKTKRIRRLFQQVEMRITHTLGLAICSPAKKNITHFFKLNPSVVKKIVSHPAQLDVTVRAFW
jgi:hypothetical protein